MATPRSRNPDPSAPTEGNATDRALATIAEREAAILAPYAMHSIDTRGRRHPQEEHAYRGPFQRDRDRILHCAAFRRLAGKMQVFTGERGDYHRTRLTHTMEVASIARTIGRALRLNEDLIEALALLHDLGHPPFGHAGEDALDECLHEAGGFSHNRHALVIVEQLEEHYTEFPGLNLTHEVLSSQQARADKNSPPESLLEARVVDAADSITYNAHDTDDAVKLGLVTLDELAEVPLAGEGLRRIATQQRDLPDTVIRKALVHYLIDQQVGEVLRTAGPALAAAGIANAEEARRSNLVFGGGDELAREKRELELFLRERVYRHPDLLQVRDEAKAKLRQMFDFYAAEPQRLPAFYQQRHAQVGVRAVGDFLAGMTDRYCLRIYREQFGQ